VNTVSGAMAAQGGVLVVCSSRRGSRDIEHIGSGGGAAADVWLRPDCHIAWLASLAADLFEQWSNEVVGIIGHAANRVVPYLITGSLAVDMAARSAELGGAGLVVEAWKTSAGRPMIMAWLPFAGALTSGEGRVC
jgi:hypothetical protein